MPTLIHSVSVQNNIPGADTTLSFELAVNPLSVVLINLRPLNDTGTTANYAAWLEVCQAINRLSILHRGQSIISMRGEDAAMLASMRHNCSPWLPNPSLTNDDRVCVTLPIFMGRRPYDPKSCFPATRSGELVLELDVDIADTGYNDLQITVETIELLNANPSEYERKVQLTRTFNAVGLNDIDLPVGNIVRGFLLFGTTAFTGATPAPSWGRIKTVVDGVEIGYSGTDFEVAHMLPSLLGHHQSSSDGHIHVETDTGGPTELPQEIATSFNNWAYLDLDPMMNDELSINTAGVSRLQLRADAETADAVRVIPIERIKI